LEWVQDVKVGCSLAHLFFGLHPNEHFSQADMVLEVMGPLLFIQPAVCEFWLSDLAVGMESIEMIFEASNISCL
jgi:hypothetical protein